MYTIGAFSKLSHISARMLRHYDGAQLSTLRRIKALKSYGFALCELPELLALSGGALARRIHERRLALYGEVDTLRATLRRMEGELANMEGTDMKDERYHVIVLPNPAQRVFGLRRTISVGQTHALFQELYAQAAQRGLRRAGATQLLFLGDEFDYGSMEVEAQMEVEGDHPDVRELPGCLCAAVTHTGPYETLKFAYDALCAWLGEHPEYRVCGPAIERYLKDEGSARSSEEYETGVLFPVVRREGSL